MEPGKLKNEKKHNLYWMAVLIAVVHPAIYAFFISFFFYLLYIGSDKTIFLVLIGLTALISILVVFLLLRAFSKDSKPSTSAAPPKSTVVSEDHYADEDIGSAIAAGMIGGVFLHRMFKDW